MIGQRYTVPTTVCDSGVVECVGSEGDTLMCVNVHSGQRHGKAWPYDRIEVASWKVLEPSTEDKLKAAEAEIERLTNGDTR